MAKVNPAQFIRQVRQEIVKITWPNRKETMISTMMVLLFVVVASLFFAGVDGVIAWAVRHIFASA
ncbi:MAG: preprotein translocase subunit SecE [Dongiaceae bacterium]